MKTAHGFTLIEMLIGMAILGILMLAFTQVFGGSLRASAEINSRNELISEAQIAQQLIASRLQSAYYVYPPATTLQMTSSGGLAKNTVRPNGVQNWTWTVGTDPILAMIVPPRILGFCPTTGSTSDDKDACFTFYAYYPVLRSALISLNPNSAPDADPQNEDTWILMEYRANLLDGITRSATATTDCTGAKTGQGHLSCPPNLATILTNPSTVRPSIKSQTGRMLIDYVQPLSLTAPYDRMFVIDTANRFVDVNVRLLQNRVGKELSVPTGNAPLSTRIYPRNWAQ